MPLQFIGRSNFLLLPIKYSFSCLYSSCNKSECRGTPSVGAELCLGGSKWSFCDAAVFLTELQNPYEAFKSKAFCHFTPAFLLPAFLLYLLCRFSFADSLLPYFYAKFRLQASSCRAPASSLSIIFPKAELLPPKRA